MHAVNIGLHMLLCLLMWTEVTICQRTFHDSAELIYVRDGGIIQSRRNVLGRKYKKMENQTWVLEAAAGNWALVFDKMDIEDSDNCNYDYLQVKEICPDLRIQRYCGNVLPLPYISESSRLELQFITDSMWERTGFTLTAYHASNQEILKARIGLTEPKENITKSLKSVRRKSSVASPMFFILLGSASAALILFGVLLIYFLSRLRRPARGQSRESEIYYSSNLSETSGSSTDTGAGSFVRLLPSKKGRKTTVEICKSSKRYSRDKTVSPGQNVALSFQNEAHDIDSLRNTKVVPLNAQHNTMYYCEN